MKTVARLAALITVLAALTALSACTSSNSGSTAEQNFAVVKPSKDQRAQIYLFRGGFNGVFSTGINEMATELRARGVPAQSLSWARENSVVYDIKQKYAKGQARPIILAGHSLGAEVVLKMARKLTSSGIPVDLVIVFDALGASRVPKGVKRFVNYRASGWKNFPGDFKPDPGFKGKIVNVDIRTLPKLDKASHWNIVNQQELQRLAVKEIESVYRRSR